VNLTRLEQKLLSLILLFLPTQLGRHFWPDFSYIYSLKVDYLSPTIYFWDLLAVCLLTLFLWQRKAVNKVALNLFLFFIITQALSLLTGMNVGAGIVRLEQYIVVGLFGVYLASSKWEKLKESLFLPISIAVIFECLLAVGQFLFEGSLGFWLLGERTFSISTPAIAKFNFQGIELLRPYATFPHPNTLAAFLVLIIPILSLTNIRKYPKTFALGLFLSIVAVILTVSRTALIAGLVELIYFLKRKGFLIIIAVILLISPFLYTRFESIFDYDNLSFIRREEFIDTSLNLFSKFPIFGIGLNNFIPASASIVSSGESRFLQPVHNIYLLTLSETGILGLTGLVVLLGYPVWLLVHSLWFMEKPKSLLAMNNELLTINLVWFVAIFLGMFDHYFLTQPQGLRVLFLIWGLSLSLIRTEDKVYNND